MLENFENYKVFYYVGKNLNITKAANELFLSQPTITKELHSFEEALGCKLFVRASKGIRLTPEGQILYEKIVPVVESLMQTEAMMKQIGRQEEGHLVLGANCRTVEHLLQGSVTRYASKYPGIGVQYLLAKRNIQDSALENGLADIGFSFRPYQRDVALTERGLIQRSHHMAYIWQPNVEIYRLLVSDVILVVGSHLRSLQEQGVLNRSNLYDYPLILWIEEDPDAEEQYAKLFRSDGRLTQGDLVVENLELMLHLLKASNAVGVVNKIMVEEELNSGEFLQLTLKESLPQQELVMFHSKLRPLRRSAQQFKELILKDPTFQPEAVAIDDRFQP